MNSESKIKKFFTSLKAKKHWEIVIAVVAVAVMLALYFSAKAKPTEKKTTTAVAVGDYCERTERELTDTLAAMKGVGKVKVAIGWESSVEKIIAYATNTSGSNITTTPTLVQTQGTSAPIVLKELYPKARGVLIICQGGNDVAVKLDIMNAVSAMLDISQAKVNVYAMK